MCILIIFHLRKTVAKIANSFGIINEPSSFRRRLVSPRRPIKRSSLRRDHFPPPTRQPPPDYAAVDTFPGDDIFLRRNPNIGSRSFRSVGKRSTLSSTACCSRRRCTERECTRPIMRSDIALLRRPLISRHLQFSRPAIHPYFVSRHASSNERLWSLPLPHPPPSIPAPGSIVITRHDGLFLLLLLLLRPATPVVVIDYFVVLPFPPPPACTLLCTTLCPLAITSCEMLIRVGVARALTVSNESAITLSRARDL